jgi:hypothetical protein
MRENIQYSYLRYLLCRLCSERSTLIRDDLSWSIHQDRSNAGKGATAPPLGSVGAAKNWNSGLL